MRELTYKQKKFCAEYLKDWNATQAAIRAGYSEKSAYSIGHENLNKPEIEDYIDLLKRDLEKLTGVSKLRNIIALRAIAFPEEGMEVNQTHQLKAIEILNKMLGYDAPTRTEVTAYASLSDIIMKIENEDL